MNLQTHTRKNHLPCQLPLRSWQCLWLTEYREEGRKAVQNRRQAHTIPNTICMVRENLDSNPTFDIVFGMDLWGDLRTLLHHTFDPNLVDLNRRNHRNHRNHRIDRALLLLPLELCEIGVSYGMICEKTKVTYLHNKAFE